MKNKKGISLIVLVITIIVMIILAGAIILSLDNAGIIDRSEEAVEKTDLKQVQYLASLKWSDAFLDGKTTQEELEDAVIEGLEEEGINLSTYQITVTEKGVDVALKSGGANVPNEWTENIVAIVDGVPIPKGFVASPYEGENTKDGGLVIYELAANETVIPSSETQHTSMTTRNQYVWVPVEDFSKFVRGAYGNATYSNTLGSGYWEVVLDTSTNIPLSTQDTAYMTSTTLAEVQAMYASVKEYEGFYIARYEAGLDVGSHKTSGNGVIIKTVHSKMNKAPYNYVRWTYNNAMNEDTNGAVEIARSIYPNDNTNTTGVVSTLTYGVQWDSVLAWWLEVGAKTGIGETVTSITNSTTYGNYYNNKIALDTFNEGAQYLLYSSSLATTYANVTTAKSPSASWLLTTGATEETRVNNIYDMAGNLYEWTMEGSSTTRRVYRGGGFFGYGSDYPVTYRSNYNPNDADYARGFRPALYIKK